MSSLLRTQLSQFWIYQNCENFLQPSAISRFKRSIYEKISRAAIHRGENQAGYLEFRRLTEND
ncbi:hypothetical protein FZX15_02825 [Brucella suis bv. 1]|uniref:Uncharacterized protein n=1 Tax=Brucella suis TaxID=29461 RepID=A0AAI8EC32_BRUSS|nr:hypothetical protein AWH03_10180 [Brucella suis 019]ATQ54076.1 hypothetical protein CS875_15895 [Brucella suis]KDV06662.1 hypothetical protein BF16_06040 [Brucella suis 1330]QFR25482.1 hypothetical protein FZX15_02825 [Brucella suis bv. 1]PXG05172.1 hypothetical protein DMP29_16090 [Brucella suis]